MAEYLPIFLRVDGRTCVIVGGGAVAARKTRMLLERAAIVRVIAPNPCDAIRAMRVELVRKPYANSLLDNAILVIAATDDAKVNRQVYEDATARGIPVNVADDPEHCAFIMGAIARRGSLQIAVGSGGQSPSVTQWMRDRIANNLPDEIGDYTEFVGGIRKELMARGISSDGLPAIVTRPGFVGCLYCR